MLGKLIILVIVQLIYSNSEIQKQRNIQQYPLFKDYVITFNKNYQLLQYQRREQIYNTKLKQFLSITQYRPGVNQFTDLTPEEISNRKTLKLIPNPQSNVPLKLSVDKKVSAPTSLDWRQMGVVTRVKDQGSCGSCWTFAGAGYAQSKIILQGKADLNIDFSQQYLLQCTKYSRCDGGFMEYVMEQMAKGVPLESQYPYSPDMYYSGICAPEQIINVGGIVEKYYKIDDSSIIQLLRDSPIPILVASHKWQFYREGIFWCDSDAAIDHAVLLVGYTQSYWIVKNQWGERWGEGGFMRIARDQSGNCKIGSAVYRLGGKSNIQGIVKNSQNKLMMLIGIIIMISLLIA